MIPGYERYIAIQEITKAGLEGEAVSRLFRYGKVRGETLFFVFGHPMAKAEFVYARERILERMRHYYKLNKSKLEQHGIRFRLVEALVVFAPKTEILRSAQNDVGSAQNDGSRHSERSEESLYKEKSKGNFVNAVKEPHLRAKIEEIRKIIKERV